MGAKPRLMVRLAPSYLHALEWIAARQGTHTAELARVTIQAQIDKILLDHAWRAQWQEAYNADVNARAAARAAGAVGQNQVP